MPKNLLYKYRCKELACNLIIRSDKWNKHCETKHKFKFTNNIEIKKDVIEVRYKNKNWEPYKSEDRNEENVCHDDEKNTPSTSTCVSKPVQDDELREGSKSEIVVNRAELRDGLGDTGNSENVLNISINDEKNEKNIAASKMQNAEELFTSSAQFEEESLALSTDPSDYSSKKLPAELIHFLLSKRNEMSVLNAKTKFEHAEWIFRCLPDGTKQVRNWLVYSPKKDAVYCLHCLIFGLPIENKAMGLTCFAVNGYCDWSNASRDVLKHEKSGYHGQSDLALIRWNMSNRIDKSFAERFNNQVDHYHAVLSVIIDCVRYLIEEMSGFRNNDNLKGKLFNLFQLLAKYNSDAKIYYDKVIKYHEEGKRMRINFLAYNSVVNLLTIMKKLVIDRISKRVGKNGGSFSLIVDSTQDSSKMESTVVLIRYIEGFEDNLSISSHPIPVERLVGIFTSKETIGKVLFDRVINVLKECNLDAKKIVGQSYDGAGNMSGGTKGMKTYVQEVCPMALYIWCHSHRFNLVIEKSLDECQTVKSFFGILEELHTFMNGHRRHGVFVETLKTSAKKRKDKNLSKRRLKRVFTTRWSSKSSSCKTLNDCFEEVIMCLETISNDKTMSAESISSASGLKIRMLTFDFIASLKICIKIFDQLSPVTLILQGTAMDFGSATAVINNVVNNLNGLRNEEEKWNDLKNCIFDMCADFNVETSKKRKRTRKRFFDEAPKDDEDNFDQLNEISKLKIDTFYGMIDALLMQINERFSEGNLEILSEMMIFLHENLLLEGCDTQAPLFCLNYNLDVDKVQTELREFKKLYKVMEKDIYISDLIPKKGIKKSRETPHEPEDCDKKSELDDVSKSESMDKNDKDGPQIDLPLSEIDVNESDADEDKSDMDIDKSDTDVGKPVNKPDDDDAKSDSDISEFEENENPEEENENGQSFEDLKKFVIRGFIKPFRLLCQSSSFNHLMVVYKILVTLAVTSCSAERAFSKEKIIKNPLRSTMLDEWLSCMMILCSECDILESISNQEIIEQLAVKSKAYSKILLKK